LSARGRLDGPRVGTSGVAGAVVAAA